MINGFQWEKFARYSGSAFLAFSLFVFLSEVFVGPAYEALTLGAAALLSCSLIGCFITLANSEVEQRERPGWIQSLNNKFKIDNRFDNALLFVFEGAILLLGIVIVINGYTFTSETATVAGLVTSIIISAIAALVTFLSEMPNKLSLLQKGIATVVAIPVTLIGCYFLAIAVNGVMFSIATMTWEAVFVYYVLLLIIGIMTFVLGGTESHDAEEVGGVID